MRKLLTVSACVLAAAAVAAQPRTILDNTRVHIVEAKGNLPAGELAPAVVVRVPSGEAEWIDASARGRNGAVPGSAILVHVKNAASAAPPPPSASQPGGGQFTGMSFKTLFENDKVRVIRARMEVGAREAFHTHAADTVVVHLSGGEIEDTADGKTKTNRWKPGDVEFEARGSSHSARNISHPIDVVLVALKP